MAETSLASNRFWKFVFELGQLRRNKREGWRLAGVGSPESVADHSLRAAQIGFVLAKMEGYQNPYEVCTMLVFHDIGEARVGDIHKVANRYINVDEKQAVCDQVDRLGEIGAEINTLWSEVEDGSSTAGMIAKDADKLEGAAMAKEYIEQGYAPAQDWINNIRKVLQTESAKKLLNDLSQNCSTDWWSGLKKQ